MIINLIRLDKIVIAVITMFAVAGATAKLYQYDWLCYTFLFLSLMVFVISVFYNRKLTPFYNRKLTHLIKIIMPKFDHLLPCIRIVVISEPWYGQRDV